MRVRDLVYETATALDSNRGRSALTILGIVIGISAVIAMTALIGGIKQSLIGSMGLDRARMVTIYAWPNRAITIDDVSNLAQLMPEYEQLTALGWASGTAKSETKSFSPTVVGVQSNYYEVTGSKFLQGAPFSELDDANQAQVVIIDQSAARNLYGKDVDNVIGRSIQVNDVAYRIVGMVESDYSGGGETGTVVMPFSTCSARLRGSWEVTSMLGLAGDEADLSTISETTQETLKKYFNMTGEDADDSVYAYTMQSIIDEVNTMMSAFQLIMTAVASISLLVGGIGIMNMMLTNVTERIREIGLRKALGARRSDITAQFLMESVCLCIVGGIIGIIVGYFAAYGLAMVAGDMIVSNIGTGTSNGVKPVIDVASVAEATGICVLIGVLFGYYPANRAAKLDPVESLHYQ